MSVPQQQALIERIHASGTPLVLAVTGGGSGALAALLQVPGASATVLEAVVPYSAAALEHWLSGRPDQHCSERTARAMAMAAFQRARQLSDVDPHMLRGIGATSSLATNRPKRGPHRIHVAWQSANATVVISAELPKGAQARADEEEIATKLVLDVVAEACGVQESREQGAGSRESVEQRRELRAPSSWTKLLLGEHAGIVIANNVNAASATWQIVDIGLPLRESQLLFPGAFNPIHAGHERMAAIAAERFGLPVTWELSIANVDKPPLDFIEISDRLASLPGRRVMLTRAATFAEKAALAPGCTFIVGADTVQRIGDARYYDGDDAKRDAAIAAIATRGCRFLVFGRMFGESFRALSDLDLPGQLRELCDEVPESEFRHDLASSEIRSETRFASRQR